MKAFRSPNGWAVELLEAEAAIKAAVIAEREACAKFVDHILKEGGGTYGDAIRERGQS